MSYKENLSASEKIRTYYEVSLPYYRFIWYSPDDLALHFGYWDESTKSRKDACLNENKFLAERAHLAKSDYILDAGCGVGGSAIFLAKTYGAKVVGISNVPVLIRQARENARKHGAGRLATFKVRDLTDTKFAENTFDVVWEIEAFCQVLDKEKLFQEMYRILKLGGRLVIADCFQKNPTKGRFEQKLYEIFTTGFAVYKTQWWEEYKTLLEKSGFLKIRRWDMTEASMPSARYIYRLGVVLTPIFLALYPFLWIFEGRRHANIVLGNLFSAITQWWCLLRGLWIFGVYYAEK